MPAEHSKRMEALVALAKRRGFVFASSEIYGGLSAVYDYGHYGILLKKNIQEAWWKAMVQEREDVLGLDSAIFMHPTTWKASGHLDSFDDPQIDCKTCKARYRADHILEAHGIDADKASLDFVNEQLDALKAKGKLHCQNCGGADFTQAKRFSLMVKSNLGAPTDALSEEHVVYLRPETCGGIYLEYKNTVDAIHPKFPFGMAQVGKAFRNEIVARQFIFRTREFEQMEMQYFHKADQTKEVFEAWKQARWDWFLRQGVPAEKMRWHEHSKLAHYASAAFDIEYDFACLGGFKEVEGVHARGDWDLSQHAKHSGQELTWFDAETKEHFTPHIVETSAGLNRLTLLFLDLAYTEEALDDGDVRTVMKFPWHLAPIKVAVFPLLKNKPELVEKAREVYASLRGQFMTVFDDNGNVGKRYRRQDELGTPFCITVDFDTIGKGEDGTLTDTVTVRNRDTMAQERVALQDLNTYIHQQLHASYGTQVSL